MSALYISIYQYSCLRFIEEALLTPVIDMHRVCFVFLQFTSPFSAEVNLVSFSSVPGSPILYYLAIVNHLCGKKETQTYLKQDFFGVYECIGFGTLLLVCVYVCLGVRLCMHVHVCMHVYMYVCMCMYVCTYVCMCVCMYVRVCVCMCIYVIACAIDLLICCNPR